MSGNDAINTGSSSSAKPPSTSRNTSRPKVKFRAVFVTVGTTRFDELIAALFQPKAIAQMNALGVRSLVVQHGASPMPADAATLCAAHDVALTSFPYEPDIAPRMRGADAIICHAGAGSLLEALAVRKRVVAVVNRNLMDDHQQELANALHAAKCLISTDVEGLTEAIVQAARTKFASLPRRNRKVLPGVVAQEIAML